MEGILRVLAAEEMTKYRAVRLAFLCVLVAIVILVAPLGSAAPGGDEVAAKVTEKLREIQTVQAEVAAEIWDPSSKTPLKMTIRVTGDRANQLTRMEVTQHPVFEGQIVILDIRKDQTIVYMPVTAQAYRGRSAKVAAQLGVDLGTFDIDSLLSLDPAGVLSFRYVKQERLDRLPYHVVETRPKQGEGGSQLVWVDAETYMVRKIEAFDDSGKKLALIMINDLKTNFKLDVNKLRELPRGTKITEVK